MIIEPHWRRLVGYLAADVFDESTGQVYVNEPMGTVFFVRTKSNGAWPMEFGYAVTCRHVLQAAHHQITGKTSILVNRQVEGQFGKFETVPHPTNYLDWVHSESTDLAVCRFNRSANDDVWLYPMEDCWPRHFKPGQDVFFVGMLHQLAYKNPIEAIVRSGFVAHHGVEEDIYVDTAKEQTVRARVCLVESRSWGGESGSPVFAYEEHVFQPPFGDFAVVSASTVGHSQLAGIMHGHYEHHSDVKGRGGAIGNVTVNSGIGIVIPISELRELLDHPHLAAGREQELEEFDRTMRNRPHQTF